MRTPTVYEARIAQADLADARVAHETLIHKPGDERATEEFMRAVTEVLQMLRNWKQP